MRFFTDFSSKDYFKTSQHFQPRSFFSSFWGQRTMLFLLGHLPGTPTTSWMEKDTELPADAYHSKQNMKMVLEMGGFPKTFRCIAAALLHKSTAGNLSERSFLLTELFVHRHVFDSFCVERKAAVFKITSFAIACQLFCRLIVDAATPCGTGSFMVFLHWFELFGMKILTIVANSCHQHQGKEHHSHHDHCSNKEVPVGTKEMQNMAGHLALDQFGSCNFHSQPSQPWFIEHTQIKGKMLPLGEYPSRNHFSSVAKEWFEKLPSTSPNPCDDRFYLFLPRNSGC